MPDDNFKLTRLERYFLSNQLRMLEALYPDEAEHIAITREGIERGYEMLYNWGIDHIYSGEDVMTIEECMEVWDTLEMYSAIDRAVEEIEEDELKDTIATRFMGYDGNNESKFMAFSEFTVKRLRRFEYVKLSKPNYWNSHMPVRQAYRRMLEVWKKFPLGGRFDLNREQLMDILHAAIHPESRESR